MKKLIACMVFGSMLLVLAGVVQAEVTVNEKVPINIVTFVPCANGGAGEDVTLDGTLHVVMSMTINGNNFSGKIHFQPQGVKGVGAITGDVYKATGVTQEQVSGSFVNGQFESTSVNNFRIIGPGKGNNLLVHQVFHVTFNANGDMTANVVSTSIECK